MNELDPYGIYTDSDGAIDVAHDINSAVFALRTSPRGEKILIPLNGDVIGSVVAEIASQLIGTGIEILHQAVPSELCNGYGLTGRGVIVWRTWGEDGMSLNS